MSSSVVTDVAPGGRVATHDVSFSGVAGSVFWTLLVSFILFLVSFLTIGWQRFTFPEQQTMWVGLWKNCLCDDVHVHEGQAWFKASKGLFTLALIFMSVALVLCILYMFVANVKKSIVLVVCSTLCFVSFLFMLIGVSVIGAEFGDVSNGGGNHSYSFVLAVIAMIFTLGAALLSIFQMRISGMI